MRITEKIELIKKLTEVLNSKYDKNDLKVFFNYFQLRIQWDGWGNNEDDYEIDIKSTLSNADEDILIQISSELETGSEFIIKELPKNWKNSQNLLKVFISHLSKHKIIAKQLKEALQPYHIDCFVAHEDIYPSLEWQDEILKALQAMDAFISIHCEDFQNSIWCQQEVGAAMARNMKIIPIKFDGKEDPAGFISKIQGLSRAGKNRYTLAKEIVEIIKKDEKTRSNYENICLKNQPDSDFDIVDEEIPF